MRNTIDTDMADDKKKSIKCFLKNMFGKNKPKDIEKEKVADNNDTITTKVPKKIEVETLLANFKKLEIEKKKETEKKKEDDELKNFSFKVVDDDELENFTFKVVEEDRRTERTESHSSQDSGFSEKYADERSDDEVITNAENKDLHHEIDHTSKKNDTKEKINDGTDDKHNDVDTENVAKTSDVIDSLQNLKLDDGKKKKSQVVPVSRGPVRNKVGDISGTYHPYGVEAQINHTINKHTLSGGQVIVANRSQDFTEIAISFNKDETTEELQNFSEDLAQRGVQFDQLFDLDLVQEYIDEKNNTGTNNNILKEFLNENPCDDPVQAIANLLQQHIEEQITENPIEELEQTNHLNYDKIENLDSLLGLEEDKIYTKIFPTPPSSDTVYSPNNEFYTNLLTPPRSETIPSPMSEGSIYPTNSEYISSLSPNSDCEKYQEIPQYLEEFQNDLPTVIEDDTDKKARERNTSTSSLSMKNFKDLQKEQAANFAKKDCCKANRTSCREIFLGHLKKLKAEERKSLCLKVTTMDLKTCFGVLHHILIGLSRGGVNEDLHLALFALLCEKVLGIQPELYLDDLGLDLLKAAALRCPQRPLLTRNVVHCIRTAVKIQPSLQEGKQFLFEEMDALGDTLVTACARAGDKYSSVLAELLRTEPGELPLFNVQHVNTEGYSALHVACREHSASSPRLHTVHVLLEHAAVDIWKGDVKGGDTAVHMAVNSAACDLRLVLLLFKHLDRKDWKKLAHASNRSSVTPLDYARCAAKSTTRQNYPVEVLDFLKKCR